MQGTILEIKVDGKVYGSCGVRSTPEFTFTSFALLFALAMSVCGTIYWAHRRSYKEKQFPLSFRESLFPSKTDGKPASSQASLCIESDHSSLTTDGLSQLSGSGSEASKPNSVDQMSWFSKRSLNTNRSEESGDIGLWIREFGSFFDKSQREQALDNLSMMFNQDSEEPSSTLGSMYISEVSSDVSSQSSRPQSSQEDSQDSSRASSEDNSRASSHASSTIDRWWARLHSKLLDLPPESSYDEERQVKISVKGDTTGGTKTPVSLQHSVPGGSVQLGQNSSKATIFEILTEVKRNMEQYY